MEKARKMIVLLLVITTLLCNGVFAVSAAQEDEEPIAGTYAYIGQERYLTDMDGNVYGATNWSSLEAAKAKYGSDWTYGTCSVFYAGSYYNNYYCFSDGSRMYFGVV